MNIDQLERDLTAKKAAIESALTAQMKTAEAESRERTADEKKTIDALLTEGRDLKARIDSVKGDQSQRAEIERLTSGIGAVKAMAEVQRFEPQRVIAQSMGDQFVSSEAMEWITKTAGKRSNSAWQTPTVELHATTLDTSSGSGGQLIVSDYQPGILPVLFKRLTVADLLASGTTTSNSITYMRETAYTNNAAPVSEGATKPESALTFDQVTDLVRKIAHWLPVTEEMLEDVSQIRSYIDARLQLGVKLAEEDQLLNGSGTAPAIRGILQRVGLTAALARGADTNADAIFKQMTVLATTVFVQPDGIVMNPINWQTVQLAKNANGNYLGTGPWAPAQPPMLWGLPVAVTPSIVANTALVGAFKAYAQVFRKGGIRVEATNTHMDFFVKNLVAIRAEERLALAVYRPAAFGTVTGLV